MPLKIFEERYRALVRDLLALPDDAPRTFGVVAIRDGHEAAPAGPDDTPAGATAGFGCEPAKALFAVGCMADATTIGERGEHGEDGYELMATGTARFRLLSVEADGPYLVGEVEELPDRPGEGAGALAHGVGRAFRMYQKQLAGARERSLTSGQLPDDPGVLSYLVAAAVIAETHVKQRLLEAPDAAGRLADELKLLRRECAVIRKLRTLPGVELTRQAPSLN
jgi:Lon protease-like protein